MKEYYYLTGKDQNGPFSIDELKTKGLSSETLVWSEDMDNWERLKDLPDLFKQINPKSPPPPPDYLEEKITKTEVSGQLKVTTEKTPNSAIEAIKPSKKALTWLIIWCSFHLFALLMSYSQIKFFNNQGEPQSDKFWPFVEFTHKEFTPADGNYNPFREQVGRFENYSNGIFVQYDWTEFAVYVGGALIFFLLVKISNKGNKVSL